MLRFSFKSRRRGFTLMEIMFAIAVLLLGMTGVISLYAVAVDAHRRASDQSGVALAASSLLAQVTADFAPRDIAGIGTQNSFAESFIDLCCRYKNTDVDEAVWGGFPFVPDKGVEAPNSVGFNCEVSIYPLPRDLWVSMVSGTTLPEKIEDRLAAIKDDAARNRRSEEYQFDAWVFNYWDKQYCQPLAPSTEPSELSVLLSQALEYKLVVRIIRGEETLREIDTFESIILPKGFVELLPVP